MKNRKANGSPKSTILVLLNSDNVRKRFFQMTLTDGRCPLVRRRRGAVKTADGLKAAACERERPAVPMYGQ